MKHYIQIIFLSLFFGFANLSFAEQVDINSADAKTIAANVKGVGLIKATAIVNYREKNGPFKNIDQLTNIKGIGQSIISKNRDNIRLASENQE